MPFPKAADLENPQETEKYRFLISYSESRLRNDYKKGQNLMFNLPVDSQDYNRHEQKVKRFLLNHGWYMKKLRSYASRKINKPGWFEYEGEVQLIKIGPVNQSKDGFLYPDKEK